MVGQQARKAQWVFRSLTGDEQQVEDAERAVGRDLAQAVIRESEADSDPAIAQWLNEIGGLLARQVQKKPRRTFVYRCLLMEEPNAFAIPGGFIFVTRPLLKVCEGSHEDLAFVLGHEMAHVVCGHAIQRMMAQSLITTVAGRYAAVGGMLRSQAGALLTRLVQQHYSQEQELEADQMAVRLMQAAGLDTSAVLRLMTRLEVISASLPEPLSYFSSHPGWPQRREEIQRFLD